MLSPNPLSWSVLSLASFAQAIAHPQASTTRPSYGPTASVGINGSIGTKSTVTAVGIIVTIAVVVLFGVCGCCGMIWWLCARHRKNMRGIRAQNEMTPVVAPERTQILPPSTSRDESNNTPPPGHCRLAYLDQAMGLLGGHFIESHISPNNTNTSIKR